MWRLLTRASRYVNDAKMLTYVINPSHTPKNFSGKVLTNIGSWPVRRGGGYLDKLVTWKCEIHLLEPNNLVSS